MKAWLVRIKEEQEAAIVFAETRGKARSLALLLPACEDADFVDIEAHRLPKADQYYEENKWFLDWDKKQDRIVMVNEFNFQCIYIEKQLCKICPAQECCEAYQDYLNEEGDAE